jgi:hypothetical protein
MAAVGGCMCQLPREKTKNLQSNSNDVVEVNLEIFLWKNLHLCYTIDWDSLYPLTGSLYSLQYTVTVASPARIYEDYSQFPDTVSVPQLALAYRCFLVEQGTLQDWPLKISHYFTLVE